MQDPSQGIQRELQPHVHLLSTYRFPTLPSLHPDKVAEWLLSAPRIARDQAPFYWTYLDRPVDSTIYLVWQSLSLGHEFPSDGYIWHPQETPFQVSISGGYVLEMYHAKIGYAPGEPFATHTRRRYRLHPSRNPNHNGPQPDLSLWIVHYTKADPNECIPSNVIPINMQTVSVRQHLQAQGQIVQKDFMLHDRTNWPTIAFPRGRPQGQQPMYAGGAPPTRIPQAMAYPTQHQPGPPAKRTRPNPNAPTAAASSAIAVLDDDEEDTSRGDYYDHTTPREMSAARYKQNHEWMEEVLSSPYAINQIIPSDLGLGVRGELASLTDGIFDAPQNPDQDVVKYNYVGRLDPGKADEFRKRTTELIAREKKEMERMKAKHARRMAKFQQGSMIRLAEKQLRTAVTNPEDTGPEYWRLEGKIDEDDVEDGKSNMKTPTKVSDIVAQIEASLGRHARAVEELVRIQDGGYEEAPAIPSPPPIIPSAQVSAPGSNHGSNHDSNHDSNHSGVMVGDTDMDVGNSAAGLLDQIHTGFSSTATPGSNNFPTPQAHLHSHAGTPDLHVPSPAPTAPQGSEPPTAHQDTDSRMSDADAMSGDALLGDTTGSGDWVVIPPGGASPNSNTEQQDTAQAVPQTTLSTDSPTQQLQPSVNTPITTSAVMAPSPAAVSMTAGPSNANTPGLPDFHTSPNDFADLGDLDTAGDALAGYGEEMSGGLGEGDMGDLGMEMDVGMDDSAFGDAFHGVEAATEGVEEHGTSEVPGEMGGSL